MGYDLRPRFERRVPRKEWFQFNVTQWDMMYKRLRAAGVSAAELDPYWPAYNDGLYVPAVVCRNWAAKLEEHVPGSEEFVNVSGSEEEEELLLRRWVYIGDYIQFLRKCGGFWVN
mmetsp:Transcript_6492/g.15992  ORF Transcript_6492/g.15992 Transcript_6492/m.15992 type:complete len:115 (+) Transcript_6492:236-580(+)|eukprot:CAMPEP_0179003408 /NCGR_PEP_ID=MMETSP0795-20121207/12663_1 /TAXON_ID=88552 /ORGANISM="Amoebophrya sp., Strain Ameob2" /LENGTH=114 /DNA_ID=CAMNT_0020697417 /DNA_START=83 /DNA_END=427 /DNA_ORIENTATION=-